MGREQGKTRVAADPGLDIAFVVEAVGGEKSIADLGDLLVEGGLAGGRPKGSQLLPLDWVGTDGEDEQRILGNHRCADRERSGGEVRSSQGPKCDATSGDEGNRSGDG